eukprot:COSAG04_NODE_6795_length_1253_cov_5.859619_1_plen_43_part_10
MTEQVLSHAVGMRAVPNAARAAVPARARPGAVAAAGLRQPQPP